jgi:outer membrane receptor protein involved in Fe transport
MDFGVVSQTVEVTTGAPLVEARTSDVTQLIESKTISDMPPANRKTMNAVQTLGAAVFLSNNLGQAPVYSLAGGRVQSQMTWLDGGLTQNFRLGAGQQSIDTPIDAIQEVEVISTNYPAQYGSNSGGIVIETSKSGTNRFHGSAYEYLRNDAADARGYFAINGKPKLRYNVFGATLHQQNESLPANPGHV